MKTWYIGGIEDEYEFNLMNVTISFNSVIAISLLQTIIMGILKFGYVKPDWFFHRYMVTVCIYQILNALSIKFGYNKIIVKQGSVTLYRNNKPLNLETQNIVVKPINSTSFKDKNIYQFIISSNQKDTIVIVNDIEDRLSNQI